MAIDIGWHPGAIYDLTNTTMSYDQIARKYGRTKDTIVKLKKKMNITRPAGLLKGAQAARFLEPIDQMHRNVGIHVTIFRGNMQPAQMAELLGVSTRVLRKIEIGSQEITLLQLSRIAKILNKSLAQLITPYEAEV